MATAAPPIRGVNGMALLAAVGWAVVAYAGWKNVPVVTTLRELLSGQPVTTNVAPGSFAYAAEQAAAAAANNILTGQGLGTPAGITGAAAAAPSSPAPSGPAPTGGAGADAAQTALNASIIVDVQRYLGVPYVFGGASPKGFDCSGLVTYVLHHDLGLNLPNNTHTVTAQWYVWSGAVTVPNAQRLPGDLVCYPGHIGIAADPGYMINAPDVGEVVKRSKIFSGSITRRVRVQ